MPRMARLAVALALLCVATGAAAAPELARSALLSVHGVAAPGGLALTVQGALDRPPAVSAVAARLGSREIQATQRADGSWWLPLGAAPAARLELVVTHDGIRELLTAQAPATTAADPPAGAAGPVARRKQLLWWVLNIAIVAIAALVISRRVG